MKRDFELQVLGLVMPTEEVRGFTELEKGILKKANSLKINVYELYVGIAGPKPYVRTNFMVNKYHELPKNFINIKFSKLDYTHSDYYGESCLSMNIEIIAIQEHLKNAVNNYDVKNLLN